MRRGFLAVPDPSLEEPCARPGCGDIEGVHLICGCHAWHHGRPCYCPGFVLPAPQCPHCRREFYTVWEFDLHMRFLRHLDPRCVAAEKRQQDDAARRQRSRDFRARAEAGGH